MDPAEDTENSQHTSVFGTVLTVLFVPSLLLRTDALVFEMLCAGDIKTVTTESVNCRKTQKKEYSVGGHLISASSLLL